MRLLKTGPYIPGQEKLEIIQIWGKDVPSDYAILSHRWSQNPDDEVLLQDVKHGTSHTKPAFQKVMKAIERARNVDGYQWLWIDTCCIDKSSSVELSEAINSMYSYYKNAKKCYAYMGDVPSDDDGSEFNDSAWWSRGWTLQELLAPEHVEFFSRNWDLIGTKNGLKATIAHKTRIEEDYLAGVLPIQHASIAKRMSWAALRQTTREEDLAYCLLGIFEVNMAMLYGEGERQAFMRLQEEIMKTSEDQSIFAWIERHAGEGAYHGLLADKPSCFAHTGSTIAYSELAEYNPSTMTARGLHTTLPLTPKPDGTFIATLSCPVSDRGYNDYLAVYLKRLPGGSNQFARINCAKLASVSEPGKPQELYVRQNFPNFTARTIYPYHSFQIDSLQVYTDHPELQEYRIVQGVHSPTSEVEAKQMSLMTHPNRRWSDVPLAYKMNKTPGKLTAGLIIQRTYDAEAFLLMLGASTELDVVGFDIHSLDSVGPVTSLERMQKIFNPQPAGVWMETEYHRVKVDMEEFVRNGQKIYRLAIQVSAIPKPPTITEVLEDVADLVVPAFTSERYATKAGLKDKVKRMWPR